MRPRLIFPPARTGPPVAKDHIYFLLLLFFSSFFPGDLYWIDSDKSYSTPIGRHKRTCVLATDEAMLCTLMTVELAVGIEQNFGMSVNTAEVALTYFKH